MKKIGLLFISTILLSGCSPTNGILTEKDINTPSYEKIEHLVKEQKNLSYMTDDVKTFIKELEKMEASGQTQKDFGYINMIIQDINNFERGEFSYRAGIGGYSEKEERVEFQKLVDTLDKTIAKGLKLYLEKNSDIKTDKGGISTKIGRVWVNIRGQEQDPYYEEHLKKNGYSENEIKNNLLKNDISLQIKVRDIKDEKYKQLVDSIITDSLILDSIKVGKEQNVIKLNNAADVNNETLKEQEPWINYELFVSKGEINKARITIISGDENKADDSDLKLLEKLSSELDFKNGDIKILERLRKSIKNSENGKYTDSSERFNFRYSSLKDTSYTQITRNMTEIVIEIKK